jgi:type II secretory pathway pseudopilin PulG
MKMKKIKIANDGGYTLVEAILSIVIMSIMVLGLSIVLMAFKEHLDRSWSVRVMDQYGNDVIEQLTHQLRNAVDVEVRNGQGNSHKIDIKFLDPYMHDTYLYNNWRVDYRTGQVVVNNVPLDRSFPPSQPGRGESFEIVRFTLTKYGESTPNIRETQDSYRRTDDFIDATWDIRFILRYNRKAINPGERNWFYEKEYHNRVYMRNRNLVVKEGIVD